MQFTFIFSPLLSVIAGLYKLYTIIMIIHNYEPSLFAAKRIIDIIII